MRFVEAEVYSALEVLEPGSFDLVYTGIGALCWLRDIARWAKVVAGLLRPGGRLFLREGHPMLHAIDGAHRDRVVIDRPYFERAEPLVSDRQGSYVETEVSFAHTRTLEWKSRPRGDDRRAAHSWHVARRIRGARQRAVGGRPGADDQGRARRVAAC